MINKWEYKYGIIGSVLFLLSYTLKEVSLINELNELILVICYILLLISLICVFLNYIKYSILNENRKLLYSTLFLLSSSVLFNILELLSMLKIVDLKPETILSANILMFLAILIWSVFIIIKKTIYGRSLFLLGVIGILFSFTYNLGIIIFLRLPLFYLFYIAIIFPFIKKKEKDNEISRLLRS